MVYIVLQYVDDTQVLVSGRPGDIDTIAASMEATLFELERKSPK